MKDIKTNLLFVSLNLTFLGTVFIFHLNSYLPYHAIKNTLFLILILLSLDIYVISIIRYDNFNFLISPIELILIIRLAWITIINPGIISHPSDLEFWILLGLIILTVLTRQLWSETCKSKNTTKIELYSILFIRIVWITGLVQACIGICQWFIFKEYPNQFIKTPMIGTIGMPNGYGLFVAVSVIAAFVDLKKQINWKIKILIVLSLVIMLTSLILNQSRGAILSVTITGFLLFLKKIKTIRKVVLFSFVVFLLIFCSLIFLLYQLNPESATGRWMVWRISIPIFLDHPIFGIGQGNFAKEYLNYQARFFQNPQNMHLAYKAANLKQAHNEYLQAFCESGIIGGVLFLSIWLYPLFYPLIKKKVKHSIKLPNIVFLLAPILIHSMVDTPLHVLPISILSYIILGFVPSPHKMRGISINNEKIKWMVSIPIFFLSVWIMIKSIYQYPGYIMWESGVKEASKQQWQKAILDYSNALIKLPRKSELQFYLGSAMVMSGKYSRGIYYLKQSLNGFNDRNIYLSLCAAYMKLQQYDIAIQYAKIALWMFPDHLAPHLLLGEIFYYQEKLEESKVELKKCILRDTTIQSKDVNQICYDAKRLWKQFYGYSN